MSVIRGANDGVLILCVEDEEALRGDIAEELVEAGYRVIEATDGEDALAQLEAVRPDLILCDISMPGMDGYGLLRQMQERAEDYADIPFIFLSALTDRREVVKGKLLGADDYLTKPIDFDLLLATVHARLRQVTRIRNFAADVERGEEAQLSLLSSAEGGSTGFGAVLDLISTAIVLIGAERDVCFINRAAQELIENCSKLSFILTGAVNLTNGMTGFAAWLDTLLAQADDSGLSSFHLLCNEGAEELRMVGCHLGNEGKAGPQLALFLARSGSVSPLSPDLLTALFGFTPTEGLIASALAQGEKPAEISVSLGIAQTTVAFHIRNIFQKTGVSRQASLVVLLLTSPASIL